MLLFTLKVLLVITAVRKINCCPCHEGQIRLANTSQQQASCNSSKEGRLEMCDMNGNWNWFVTNGTIGRNEAHVVCRELGFCSEGGSAIFDQEEVYGYRHIVTNCSGNEAYLNNCTEAIYSSSGYRALAVVVSCIEKRPNRVSTIAVLVSFSSIQVQWTPPANMRDCTDITEYTIRCQVGGSVDAVILTQQPNVMSVTLDPMYNRSNINCCVSGRNGAGESPSSCASRLRPSPPRSVQVISLDPEPTSLEVQWTHPQSINGHLYQYTVKCCKTIDANRCSYAYSSSDNLWLSVTVTSLEVLTAYTCCVSVNNYVHDSDARCESSETILNPPTRPTNLRSTNIQSTSITFIWSPPVQTYNQPYNIIFTCSEIVDRNDAHDLSNALDDSTTQRHTLYNLQPGAMYGCCVSAENAGGASANSCITVRTAEEAPSGSPGNLQTQIISSSTVQLSWNEIGYRQRNGAVKEYRVKICSMETFANLTCLKNIISQPQIILFAVINSLHPNYKYNWTVAGYTVVGEGPHSLPVSFRMPEDAPSGPPQKIGHKIVSFSLVHLFWSPPSLHKQNGNITGYSVQMFTMDGTTNFSFTVVEEALTVDSLQEHTTYMFQFSAMTRVGGGPHQTYGPVTTPIGWKYGLGIALVALLLILTIIGIIVCCLCQGKWKKVTKYGKDNHQSESCNDQSTVTLTRLYKSKNGKEKTDVTKLAKTHAQAGSIILKIRNWLKQEKREQCTAEQPPLPMRRYLEDEEFMEGTLHQPAIPIRDKASICSQGDDEEPPIPPRVYLQDEAFIQGLENFDSEIKNEKDDKNPSDENERHQATREEEKIYQPLIPPRRYEESHKEEESVYQGLTLNRSNDASTRQSTEKILHNVNNSEGQYQSLIKPAQPSTYEIVSPKTKHNISVVMKTTTTGNPVESDYQPLMKREEISDYQPLTFKAKGFSVVETESESNPSEGHYQPLVRQRVSEANTYQSLTILKASNQ